MNSVTSILDLNMEALDVVEAPMDGGDALAIAAAFGAGVLIGMVPVVLIVT